MGKILAMMTIILVVTFFLLPVAAGHASFLRSLSPEEVGRFLRNMLRYWLAVALFGFR